MHIKALHEGKRVRYVPGVAQGDVNHEACEDGTVTSWNGSTVFVRYTNKDGSVQPNSKATSLSDLHEVP